MKILLLMDPYIPVPPKHYGGIERVVYDVACKYVEMGHEVTILAGPNSKSPGQLVEYGKNTDLPSIKLNIFLSLQLGIKLWPLICKHDVIHNFGRLFWLYLIFPSKIRKVHTYMRYITPNNVKLLNRIGVKNIAYTAVSNAIVNTGITGGGDWSTIYNCTPINQFKFVSTVTENAPLLFLGRLERCKGAHSAIAVAKLTNRRLIIAGNISALREEQDYFNKEILPHIDGELIQYVGVVDNYRKNELLGQSAAMLLPVEWFEPFPIVLPESYACGTPILAFPGGGVPEGIFEGITGFISNSVEEMAKHVLRIEELSRLECRRKAEMLYSDHKIANDYLKLYLSK
jgi:glycosyltransferase involved in cell wall biosynthesis